MTPGSIPVPAPAYLGQPAGDGYASAPAHRRRDAVGGGNGVPRRQPLRAARADPRPRGAREHTRSGAIQSPCFECRRIPPGKRDSNMAVRNAPCSASHSYDGVGGVDPASIPRRCRRTRFLRRCTSSRPSATARPMLRRRSRACLHACATCASIHSAEPRRTREGGISLPAGGKRRGLGRGRKPEAGVLYRSSSWVLSVPGGRRQRSGWDYQTHAQPRGRGAHRLDGLFGRRAGVQSMGRVQPHAPAWPYRQQPQKRFCVRF